MRTAAIRIGAAAALWLFAASDASATFLQTDPVGYKDDLNAYMYVHDDPTDLTDPMGLQCVGLGDKSACTLDKVDGRNVTDAMRKANPAIARLEGKLTKAYKQIQAAAARGQTIHIAGNATLGIGAINIPAAKLLGDAQRSELKGVTATITRIDPSTGKAYTPGMETYNSSGVTTIYRPMFNRPSLAVGGFKHELLHEEPSTEPWNDHPLEHQKPFNDAVDPIR